MAAEKSIALHTVSIETELAALETRLQREFDGKLALIVDSRQRESTAVRQVYDTKIDGVVTLFTQAAERDRAAVAQRFVDNGMAVAAALAAAKEAVVAALAAADRAVTKAETAVEKRLEGVNEFRAALSDQQRSLLPRNEAEIRFRSLDDAMSRVTTFVTERQTEKETAKDWRGYLAAGFATLVALATLYVSFRR